MQSNTNKIFPLEVERQLSKDTMLPGTTVDVQIMVKNTTQHPIEALYITEGDIQPANEVELFPSPEIGSLQFIHQGIITVGKQHKFHYSITLHPYSSSEHISITDMSVEFSANRKPIQLTIPGTTIEVGSIPIEDLEISEGYYTCPNCGEHLEFDTVLCTHCGFEINQKTLQKIWANHQSHKKLIEEEFIQTDEKSVQVEEPIKAEEKIVPAELPAQMEELVKAEEQLLPIEEERIRKEEIPAQMEEKEVEAEEKVVPAELPAQMEEKEVEAEEKAVPAELPAQVEIMYLKEAARAFREEKFEECLLNLNISLQIIKQSDSTALQSANGVVKKLLSNIMAYDGKPVSKRTAATSLKFVINFVKSFKDGN